jgi:hypothetical protein
LQTLLCGEGSNPVHMRHQRTHRHRP